MIFIFLHHDTLIMIKQLFIIKNQYLDSVRSMYKTLNGFQDVLYFSKRILNYYLLFRRLIIIFFFGVQCPNIYISFLSQFYIVYYCNCLKVSNHLFFYNKILYKGFVFIRYITNSIITNYIKSQNNLELMNRVPQNLHH